MTSFANVSCEGSFTFFLYLFKLVFWIQDTNSDSCWRGCESEVFKIRSSNKFHNIWCLKENYSFPSLVTRKLESLNNSSSNFKILSIQSFTQNLALICNYFSMYLKWTKWQIAFKIKNKIVILQWKKNYESRNFKNMEILFYIIKSFNMQKLQFWPDWWHMDLLIF